LPEEKEREANLPVLAGGQTRQNSLSEAFLTLWLLLVSSRGKVGANETWDFV
jgi:hypothetical protein